MFVCFAGRWSAKAGRGASETRGRQAITSVVRLLEEPTCSIVTNERNRPDNLDA